MSIDQKLINEIVIRVVAVVQAARVIIGGIAYPANKYGNLIYAAS